MHVMTAPIICIICLVYNFNFSMLFSFHCFKIELVNSCFAVISRKKPAGISQLLWSSAKQVSPHKLAWVKCYNIKHSFKKVHFSHIAREKLHMEFLLRYINVGRLGLSTRNRTP